MNIGDTIKRVRNEAKMTQVEFSKSLEISQTAVTEYERGIRTPSLKVAKKIIDFAKQNKIKLTLTDIFSE